MARPLRRQIFVEPSSVGNLRERVDARLYSFFGSFIALIDQNLNQRLKIPFFARESLNELLQLLVCCLTLAYLGRETGAQAVKMLLQQVSVLVRRQKGDLIVDNLAFQPVDFGAQALCFVSFLRAVRRRGGFKDNPLLVYLAGRHVATIAPDCSCAAVSTD